MIAHAGLQWKLYVYTTVTRNVFPFGGGGGTTFGVWPDSPNSRLYEAVGESAQESPWNLVHPRRDVARFPQCKCVDIWDRCYSLLIIECTVEYS